MLDFKCLNYKTDSFRAEIEVWQIASIEVEMVFEQICRDGGGGQNVMRSDQYVLDGLFYFLNGLQDNAFLTFLTSRCYMLYWLHHCYLAVLQGHTSAAFASSGVMAGRVLQLSSV